MPPSPHPVRDFFDALMSFITIAILWVGSIGFLFTLAYVFFRYILKV